LNPTPSLQPNSNKRLNSEIRHEEQRLEPTSNRPMNLKKIVKLNARLTHSAQPKKSKPHARNFTHEKTAKIPIMKSRDAISLTPFWAFGQSAAAGPLVQTRFKVDRLRARSRAICLNEFEQV
jgi:hypothetical protein